MTQRLFIAWFGDEHGVLGATTSAREAGLTIHDVFTPYAVHGMDAAMGLRPSRLPWVCFTGGVLGFAAAVALQVYTSAVSWPLNVGGKPFASLPAFIPVTFEMTVLSAALISVAALFVRARLRPRLALGDVIARVTNDRFALALAVAEDGWNEAKAGRICARHGALETGYAEVGR